MNGSSDTNASRAPGATGAPSAAQPGRLYPASIAFLIEERPLLWFEKPEQYDELRREIFAELAPAGALECILVKHLVDYIWELRRMKKLKHTAINFVMPSAAQRILAPNKILSENKEAERVRSQATDVAYGAEEELGEGEESLADRMEAMRTTPEMIHYRTHNEVADNLYAITRECERLEGRFHSLLRDFEKRRATLAAMARSLVERERAEVIEYKEVN